MRGPGKQKKETRDDRELRGNSAVERLVSPKLCEGAIPDDLWQVGDIVTRDGTDEHEILSFHAGRDIFDVKCIKEPSDTWAKVGEIETNLVRRYSFVRPENQTSD